MPANRSIGNLLGVAPGVWNKASSIQVGADAAPFVCQHIVSPLASTDPLLSVLNVASGTTATFWNMNVESDYPRGVTVTITGGAPVTKTVTIEGTDGYNVPQTSEFPVTSGTPVLWARAFKKITKVSIDSAYGGGSKTIDIHFNKFFGLKFPFADRVQVAPTYSVASSARVITPGNPTTVEDDGNFQPGDPNINDATSALDRRGTYEPQQNPDGNYSYKLYYMAQNLSSIVCIPNF